MKNLAPKGAESRATEAVVLLPEAGQRSHAEDCRPESNGEQDAR